jgi:hypothetical protein
VSKRDGQSFRFNSRVEYNIDSSQSIIYTPRFTYGYNDSKYLNTSEVFNAGLPLSKYDNQSTSYGKNITFQNELMYRKKLKRRSHHIS